MIAALSGASGFIGKALSNRFRGLGWDVRVIDRESFRKSDHEFAEQFIDGSEAVIHLAGAPIAKKWTEQYKKEIMESRTLSTRRIASAIGLAARKPSIFISFSAIGIYDSFNTHTESSTAYGTSFLAEVCRAWEKEAMEAAPHTRLVILRTGVVLGSGGGALEKMHLPFSLGLGGRTGSGKQPVSFIHLDDLVDAIIFLIGNRSVSGIVNAVSPFPVSNAEFTGTLAKALHQPGWLATPAYMLKMLYGEGASLLLEGQRVLPEKLEQAGFRFRYPTLQNALVQIYG
jgi:uncharacterized protein (TIGR01777 family)